MCLFHFPLQGYSFTEQRNPNLPLVDILSTHKVAVFKEAGVPVDFAFIQLADPHGPLTIRWRWVCPCSSNKSAGTSVPCPTPNRNRSWNLARLASSFGFGSSVRQHWLLSSHLVTCLIQVATISCLCHFRAVFHQKYPGLNLDVPEEYCVHHMALNVLLKSTLVICFICPLELNPSSSAWCRCSCFHGDPCNMWQFLCIPWYSAWTRVPRLELCCPLFSLLPSFFLPEYLSYL